MESETICETGYIMIRGNINTFYSIIKIRAEISFECPGISGFPFKSIGGLFTYLSLRLMQLSIVGDRSLSWPGIKIIRGVGISGATVMMRYYTTYIFAENIP